MKNSRTGSPSCSKLTELPPPPIKKTGWPWTEETPTLPPTQPDGSPWLRISIVTTSYNQGEFLEESIRSVLLQGYPNLEYIVIDGGSTDGSVELMEKYSPWLTYWVSEKDRGQSHAVNKGFEKCTGDIITFLSSDDIYLPGTFADLGMRWREAREYGAIIGAFNYIDSSSQADAGPIEASLPHEGPIDLSLGPPGIYRLHQVSTFYSREALDCVGRWVRENLEYTMDRELLYRVCRKYRVLIVNETYGGFRKHDQSKSVAAVLPFSREFARLYLLHLSGDKGKDRLRIRMSRYHRARGFMKYAKTVKRPLDAVLALFMALFYKPDYVFQPAYVAAWRDLLFHGAPSKSSSTT